MALSCRLLEVVVALSLASHTLMASQALLSARASAARGIAGHAADRTAETGCTEVAVGGVACFVC